jgi:hypothetical protein
MEARPLAASAKKLAIVRQRESATGIRVTGTEKRTKTKTEIAIATANGKGTGTGTEIMTVTANATVIVRGTENVTATVTAIVRGSETVAPGTTVTMHDGHRVTTVAIGNGIGRATHHETVVTETVIGMEHEGQVRERTTGNGVQEGTETMTEAAKMSRERSARERTRSEVRKCVEFSLSQASPSKFLTLHVQRAKYDTEAPLPKDRKGRAETPEEGEI